MRPVPRPMLVAGTFALAALAGLGVGSAAGGRDAASTPPPSTVDEAAPPEPAPIAVEPVEVLGPASVGEPPLPGLLDELLGEGGSGDGEGGDDGAPPGAWPFRVGTGDPGIFTGAGDRLPPEVLARYCPGDDAADPACASDAAGLLDRAAVAADSDDGGSGDDVPGALLDLLCAGGPDDGDGEGCHGAARAAIDDGGGGRGSDDAPGADDPVLVDLCAGPEPIEGCDDDGVPATILLALTAPVDIYLVDLQAALTPLCAAAGPLGDGQVSVTVVANQPVAIEGTAAGRGPDGVLTAAVAFAGAATDEAHAWFDADPAHDRTVTCAPLDLPAGDHTEVALDLVASGDGDGEPAHWSGVVPLPDPGPPSAPPGGPADLLDHDPDRPPVQVVASGRRVTAHVHRARDETLPGLLALVPRAADAPEQDRCQGWEDGELAPTEHVPIPFLRQVTAVGTRFSVRETFEVSVPDRWYRPGPWDACVVIRDTLSPPSVLERHAVPLVAPEERSYDVVASYQPVGGFAQPTALRVQLRTGASHCDERLTEALLDPVERGAEPVICTVRHHPDDVHWGIVRQPDYALGPARDLRALVRAPDPGCVPDRWLPSCSAYYVLDVRGPDLADGSASRDRHGALTIGFRPHRLAGPTTWVVGPPTPYGETRPSTFPRLDLSSLSVAPAPDDPVTGLEVRWGTDRPAEALVRARYWPDRYAGDPLDPCPGGLELQAEVAATADGRVVLPGACAGSRYQVSIHLRDPGAARWAVGYVGDDHSSSGAVRVPIDPVAASSRTDRVLIRVSVELELEMWTPGGARPVTAQPFVIPSYVFATAGGVRTELSQHYGGTARVGLHCEQLPGLGRAAGPEVVESGWQVLVGVGVRLHTWDLTGRHCPNAGEQLRRDRSRTGSTWHLSSHRGWDVRDLLERGEVRFEGEALEVLSPRVLGDSSRLRATVTVRAEPA